MRNKFSDINRNDDSTYTYNILYCDETKTPTSARSEM